MHTSWDVFQWGVGTPQANSPLGIPAHFLMWQCLDQSQGRVAGACKHPLWGQQLHAPLSRGTELGGTQTAAPPSSFLCKMAPLGNISVPSLQWRTQKTPPQAQYLGSREAREAEVTHIALGRRREKRV